MVGFFVIGGWVAVFVLWRSASPREHGFRAETSAILKSLHNGQAGQVYDEASPLFRRDVTREYFVILADRMTKTLGSLKKIVSTIPGETTTTKIGKTAYSKSRLRFENAVTTGEFNFHYLGKKWRLLGFDIQIPDKLQTKARLPSQVEDPAQPGQFSDALRQQTKTLFENIRDGKTQEVYEGSSEAFRNAVSKERFETIVKLHKKRFGKLESIGSVSMKYQDKWKTYVEVELMLKYKRIKGKTKATVEFIRIDNQWKLLTYRVAMTPH